MIFSKIDKIKFIFIFICNNFKRFISAHETENQLIKYTWIFYAIYNYILINIQKELNYFFI